MLSFMKTVQWEPTDRRTDITKLIVDFRNFPKAPKKAFTYEDRNDFRAACLSVLTVRSLPEYDKRKYIGPLSAFFCIANFLISGVRLIVAERDSFIA